MHEIIKSHISFYFNQYRVHVFMDVLRGMGCPSRICFMIDFSGNRLLITPYSKRDFKSHCVPKKVYTNSDGLEINSMKLCKIISQLHKLDEEESYRFPGIVDVTEHAAMFDLTKPQLINQFREEAPE